MTAEEFDSAVFAEVVDAAATGLQVLSRSAGFNLEDTRISDVDDLAQAADQPSDYLLGQEPIWGDLQYGRAITRENDDQIRDGIRAALAESNYKGVVVVTGTAGSGKSTALRRLALRLSAEGKRVGWIEAERSVSPRVIRHWMRSADARRSLLSTMQTCTDRSWRI
jgi:Mrp family chromosome partitioning ATPase